MNENDVREDHEFINRLRKVFPPEVLDNMEKEAKAFFDRIREDKPNWTMSNKSMNKVLKLYPEMRANQIDDFLLLNGIGDDKALHDYLDIVQKNKDNIPEIK